MRILVTGHRGNVGAPVAGHLGRLGHDVVGGFLITSRWMTHPRRAMRAYGLSKCLAEDMCAGFTARTGIASVSLRPVWVWDSGQYQRIEMQWRAEPGSEWEPF